ncbi:MAG: DUF4364 family protein [Lachnospiraceae bacterium]|nr:DUF4364 family protein [Lachnospiraceae bacterium]
MAEPNMIYKISVLLLLSKVDSPLSNAQIVQFYLDKEYTDYFTIQQVISDLEDAELVTVSQSHNNTLYSLTPDGKHTLELMHDKITPAIEEDIISYLGDNKLEIKNHNALFANYDKATGGGYIVHCKYIQDKQVLLDLSIHTSSVQQAETICNNWRARHEDVYMSLMDTLIS